MCVPQRERERGGGGGADRKRDGVSPLLATLHGQSLNMSSRQALNQIEEVHHNTLCARHSYPPVDGPCMLFLRRDREGP